MRCLNCCLFTFLLGTAIAGLCLYISTDIHIAVLTVNRSPCFDCDDHPNIEAYSQQCCKQLQQQCVAYQYCSDLRSAQLLHIKELHGVSLRIMIASQLFIFLLYWLIESFTAACLVAFFSLLGIIDSYFLCYLITFALVIRRPPRQSAEGEARLRRFSQLPRPQPNRAQLRRMQSEQIRHLLLADEPVLNNNNSSRKFNDTSNVCSVCMDEISAREKKVLRCGHGFHIVCIEEWFQGKLFWDKKCPNCREQHQSRVW